MVFFRDTGISLLTHRFLPSMHRLGEVCLMFIDAKTTMFVIEPQMIYSQDRVIDEGPQYVARINSSLLFQEDSSFQDSIAFTVKPLDLNGALQKLAAELPDGVIRMELTRDRAYLCEDEGYSLVLTCEKKTEKVLVHRFLSKHEIEALRFFHNLSLPERSAITPDLNTLVEMLESLCSVSALVNVIITQSGDLYLNCGDHDKDNMIAEFRRQNNDKGALPNVYARLRQACSSTETYGVRVSTRKLLQCLDSYLTMPDGTCIGTCYKGTRLVLALRYNIPGTCELSDSMCFYCMIPSYSDGKYWRYAT